MMITWNGVAGKIPTSGADGGSGRYRTTFLFTPAQPRFAKSCVDFCWTGRGDEQLLPSYVAKLDPANAMRMCHFSQAQEGAAQWRL